MTFSIIVPTFNEERFIANTLEAIRHHLSNIDYELIVTDDGSTDRTCDIAERYADRVVRLMGPKGTIGANRNRGARVAHGEYLVFVDADIFIPRANDCFAAIAADFKDNPRLVGLTVKITFAPGEERLIDAIMHGVLSRLFWFMNRCCGRERHRENSRPFGVMLSRNFTDIASRYPWGKTMNCSAVFRGSAELRSI